MSQSIGMRLLTRYPVSAWLCLSQLLLSIAIIAECHADQEAMNAVLFQTMTRQDFVMCHAGGCADTAHVSLTDDEWLQVRATFDPMPENAAAERVAIAKALGVMEQLVGAKTGTSTDRAGTFGNAAYPGQLDCNDEAINSTSYMRLLEDDGLIHFHKVGSLTRRGFFLFGFPHSAASLQELANQAWYVVDSSFFDNGEAATILPMAKWKDGWIPAKDALPPFHTKSSTTLNPSTMPDSSSFPIE